MTRHLVFTLKRRQFSGGTLLIVCAFLFFGVRLFSFQGIPDDQLSFPVDKEKIIEDNFADNRLVRQFQAPPSVPLQDIKLNNSRAIRGANTEAASANFTKVVSVSTFGDVKNITAIGVHPAWGEDEPPADQLAAVLTTVVDDPNEIVIGVLSCDKYLRTRATWVKNTWARRFRDVVYFSDTRDDAFPAVGVSHLPDDRFKKTGAWKDIPMLRHLFANFPRKRWFLIVDDDTYVLTHNLIMMVRKLDASKDWYVGQCNWDNKQRNVMFVQGGGGILMSKPLVARVYPTLGECERKYLAVYAGDIRLGFCMKDIGVTRPTMDLHFSGDSVGIVLGRPGSNAEKRPLGRPVTFSHMDAGEMVQLEGMLQSNPHGFITYSMLRHVFPPILPKPKLPIPATDPAAPPPATAPSLPAGQGPPFRPPPPLPGAHPPGRARVLPGHPPQQSQRSASVLADAGARPPAEGASPPRPAHAPPPRNLPPARAAGGHVVPPPPASASRPVTRPAAAPSGHGSKPPSPGNPGPKQALLSHPPSDSDPDSDGAIRDARRDTFSGSLRPALVGSSASPDSESGPSAASNSGPRPAPSDSDSDSGSFRESGAAVVSTLHAGARRGVT